ncbi:MAG: hypothetical protein V1747_05210 [Candidatus Omnitrophota bacterium]
MVSKSNQIRCPMCREYLEIEDTLQKGDVVYCPDCEEELKILRLDPPKLKRVVEILEVYKDDHPDGEEDYSDSYEGAFEDMFGGINEDVYGGEQE